MNQPTYHIRDWDRLYETAETRKLENLRWAPLPNKHDGLGFRRLAQQKNRCDLLSAWVLLVQVASKGRRGHRGALARDGAALTAEDLALMTGFPSSIFEQALTFFSHPKQGWLVASGEAVLTPPAPPAESPAPPADSPDAPAESPAEGKEGKGLEGKDGSDCPPPALPTPEELAESIYSQYPRKEAKGDAIKAILKAMKTVGPEKLMEATAGYALATSRWPKEERQFIPHPATWYNRGSYEDDPAVWMSKSAKQTQFPDAF